MNIVIANSNGFSFAVISKSDGACLVEKPDFGEISADFCTYKIPDLPGETLISKSLSARDVTLKFESRGISENLISRTLSPLSDLTVTVNGKYYFRGVLKATAKREQKYEIMPPIYTVQIRMFDPFFYKLNNKRTVPFLNHGVTLYENGEYKYQKLSLYNDGDVPCPITFKIKALEKSAAAGLFSSAVWNSGNPEYSGYRLNGPRATDTEFYASSDISDIRSLENYSDFKTFDEILLAPGANTLYALNCEGTIEYEPKFLTIAEDL